MNISTSPLKQLHELKERLTRDLPGMVSALESACGSVLAGTWEEAPAQQACRAAHTLAGTSGTYGLRDVSEAAAALEGILRQHLESRAPLDAARCDQVRNHLAALRSQAASPSEAGGTPRDASILIVDDDPRFLAWMDAVLSGRGYRVQSEEKAGRALEIIRRSAPDLILLDVMMPDMNGYDFSARLQESAETALIPVIFVTARSGEQDRARAFAVGAVDYVPKPVCEEKLVGKIDLHLRTAWKWKALRRSGSASSPSVHPEHGSRSADFTRFRAFLADRFKIDGHSREILLHLTDRDLTSRAREIGISPPALAAAMAEFLRIPFAARIEPRQVRLGILPTSFCRANRIVAIHDSSFPHSFVLANPFDWAVVDAVRNLLGPGETPCLQVASPEVVLALTNAHPESTPQLLERPTEPPPASGPGAPSALEQEAVDTAEVSSHIVETVNRLIENAYQAGASDIHVEPSEEEVTIRYRLDGDLRVVETLKPPSVARTLVARIKIMSELDIAEHRLPQDGRIRFKPHSSEGSDFDLRVAILPGNHGEKACLRILDKHKSTMPLDRLGFSERNLSVYREKIRAPYGMILHVGPTGSGKSMSLYAALNEIRDPSLNIQTVEDPIEYTLPGINQLQVNHDIGLTFQRALRSFLRADPDILLVGEIRDGETAHVAVEAALTGHLLLSTLHTNDAASALNRLVEMGIEPYLVSSSLLLVCAQRLLRRLCGDCRQGYPTDGRLRSIVGAREDETLTLYRPRGCNACRGTGYKGRIAVHEILVPGDGTRTLMNEKGVTAERLKRHSVEAGGMVTLYWDAMEKVRRGICSIEDALANILPDEFDSRPSEQSSTLPGGGFPTGPEARRS